MAAWAPDQEVLRQVVLMLEWGCSPDNVRLQQAGQVRARTRPRPQALEAFKQRGDFASYLVFVLTRGQQLAPRVRQAAGLVLKNVVE